MSLISRMINYISGKYVKTISNQTIFGAGNIEGGGGGGFEPTETQLAAINSGIDSEKVEQIQINKNDIENKQDEITDVNQINNPNDTDYLSDLSNTINKRWTFEKIWNYIKSKITEIYYPVGSVIFNTGTNPSTSFGGTWELYATGGKALYLDATAGTTVNEELPNPNITLDTTGAHTHTYRKQTGRNSWNAQVGSYDVGQSAYTDNQATGSNGNHTHTVNIGSSVYKDNGKVRVEGITICAWERTA